MIDLEKLIQAIARHEGYRPGTLAYKNNNPGNIKYGKFAKLHGATHADDQGHAIFPTVRHGRRALRKLLRTKFAGKTLREIGAVYAEDPRWAEQVAKIAKISQDEVIAV